VASNNIQINILGDAKGFKNTIGQVQNDLGRLGKASSRAGSIVKSGLKVAAGGFLIAGAAVVKFGGDAIQSASDLNETVSKTKQVFGANAKEILRFSKTTATSLGQSQQETLDAAGSFGIFGKAAGLTGKDLTAFSKKNVALASDMASFYNTSPKEAMDAIGAAFRGEAEPMRKYGVLLDDATMRQQALKMGLISTTKDALTPQQKILAAQALIYKQTGDIQGDFARTSGGLANQQRILAARFENVKAKIGKALLPIMLKIVAAVQKNVMPMLDRFAKWFNREGPDAIDKGVKAATPFIKILGDIARFVGNNIRTIALLVGGFYALTAAIAVITPIVTAFKAIVTAVRVAIVIWRNVQFALNLVMLANPLALVVVAIVAFVAAVVIAYKKSETFRAIVQKAWNAIKNVTVTVFKAIASVIKAVFSAIKSAVTSSARAIKNIVSDAWNAIKAVTRTVWNALKNTILLPLRVILSILSGNTGKAKNIMSNAWTFIKNATSRIWDGIKNAVGNAVSAVVNKVNELKNKVIGVFAGAAGWLVSAGKNLIQGFINGIGAMFGAVKNKLGSLTHALTSWKGPPAKDKRLLTPAGKMIIDGLIKGFDDSRGKVKNSLRQITKDIETYFNGTAVSGTVGVAYSPAVATTATKATVAVAPTTINVTIEGGFFNEVEMGRQIDGVLKKYYNTNTRVVRHA
jgi:phage-related protein